MKSTQKWINFERIITIIQVILLLGGFIVGYLELNNLTETTSGELSLQLFEDISSDRVFKNNPGIINALISEEPILQKNGGRYSEDDLNNYLALFNWIAAANESGVLSDDMVYNLHSDLLLNSYENPEVGGYIKQIRDINPDYYSALVGLVKKMEARE